MQFRQKKQDKGESLTKSDLLPILLTPLMSGKLTLLERFLKGFQILKATEATMERETLMQLQSLLYVFAGKFLDRNDLEKVKEEVKMTILGQMLRDDFIEEGRIEGRQETQERYNRLILCLDKDGKTSLIVKAASDPQLLEKLFQEYGI